MKSILFIAFLIALATSSPMPNPSEALPLVSISLIGSPSHYSVGSAQSPQDQSTSSNTWTIHIPLDIAIDLSTRPEHTQEIEINSVEAGVSIKGDDVRRDDMGVRCKLSLEWGSEGVVVVMGERVVLDNGKMVRVTGVNCWKECM
jgi:hypothetical protein